MKELMVTLLILSCTGMVCAQQDYGSTTRPSDNSSSGSNNRSAPVVPIVSASATSGSSTRGTDEQARQPLGSLQNRENLGSNPNTRGALSSRDRQPVARKNFSERATGLTQDTGFSGESGVTRETGFVRQSSVARETGVARTSSFPQPIAAANPNPSEDKVIYLGLPDSQLGNLQKYGSVEADVRNPFVDRITISDQDRPKATPVRNIEPILRGDKLVFQFNETQLAHLDDYSFEFNVPTHMKGKYSKAVIEYPPALQRASQANQVANTRTISNTGQAPPRFGTGFESDDQRWRLAGQQIGNRTTPSNIRPVAATTATNNSYEIERQRQLDLERQIELERQRGVSQQRLTYQQQQQQQYRDQQLREQEALQQISLADRNRQLEDQLSRMRYEQQQAASRVAQGTWPAPLTPVVDRFADQRFGLTGNTTTRFNTPPTFPSMLNPVMATQPTNESLAVSLLQSQMQNKLQGLENRIAQLGQENRHLGNQMNAVKSENDLLHRFNVNGDYRRDLANRPTTQDTTRLQTNERAPRLPERPVMSTGGLDRSNTYSASDRINNRGETAPTTKTSKRGSWDLLMFLMLLASVALNLYLWAVSRGFYMRYQELADELRETFAVTT